MVADCCRARRREDRHECNQRQADQGRDRRLGSRDRHGNPRPGHLELKTVFRRLDRVRRRPQQPRLAGRCRDARMLPVINEECVRQAVRTGLGLNAKINLRSVFDRKNYFYPDSPQGYQISQYKSPVVGRGRGRGRASTAARPPPSASNGCTWSRTPPNCCMTSRRRCPLSISTLRRGADGDRLQA